MIRANRTKQDFHHAQGAADMAKLGRHVKGSLETITAHGGQNGR